MPDPRSDVGGKQCHHNDPPGRILVVEDVEPLRRFLVKALELWGYEVDGVGSVAAMRLVLEAAHPHAVILDWNLDGQSSHTVLGELQRQGLSVVIVTGDPGAVGEVGVPVLAKPIGLDILRTTVETALS